MMRRLCVAMASAMLVATPALAASDDDGNLAAVSFRQGMAAIEAHQPDKAIELVRPVLARFEREHAGEKRQMFCAITPQQSAAYLADAARAKHEAVAVGPDWCRAQYVNAYALIDLERLPEARAAFERLVALAPQNARYLNELGFVLVKQRQWPEALAAYRRADAAADLSPDSATTERCRALKGVGYTLVEMGDVPGAAASYRRCLAVDPSDADAPRELDYIQQQFHATA